MKRRIVSVLMALVMALSLLPVQALAEDAAVGESVTEIEQAEQTGKGEEPGDPEEQTGEGEEPGDPEEEQEPGEPEEPAREFVQGEAQLTVSTAAMAAGTAGERTVPGDIYEALSVGGSLKLLNDVEYSGSMDVAFDLVIDLNGYVLKMNGIKVENGGSLTIIDSAPQKEHKFTPNDDGLWVRDEQNGTKTVKGGVIYGGTGSSIGTSVYGGGVYVVGGGRFTMEGGNIVGCTASTTFQARGGGVFVAEKGTFTMSGGSIAGCTTVGGRSYGGGIYNEGTMTLSGTAEIRDCHAKDSDGDAAFGGGISDNGEAFQISGNVRITGCTASGGGMDAVSMGTGSVISGGTFDGSVQNTGTISGGTFNGRVVNSNMITDGIFNGEVVNDYGTITGGTFNGVVTSYVTISEGAISGIIVTYQVNGAHYATQIVPSGSTAIKPVDPINSAGAEFLGWDKDDGTKWDFNTAVTENTTLMGWMYVPVISENALLNALSGSAEVIRLTGDIDISSSLTVNRTVTLDLNNHVLTITGENSFITVSGQNTTLTLTDSAETKTERKFRINQDGTWVPDENGDKTVSGGVITGGITGVDLYGTPTVGGGVLIENRGTLTVTDGTVNVPIGNRRGTIAGSGTFNGTVINEDKLTGGTFNGPVANYKGLNKADATISGGIFYGTVANGYNYYVSGQGEMTLDGRNGGLIADGTFYGKVTNAFYSTISGGSFYGEVDNRDRSDFHPNYRGILAGGTFYAGYPGTVAGGCCTVTYEDGQAGVPYAIQIVQKDEKAVKPTEPKVNGFTFGGWNKADGTAWDFTKDTVTENITLSAKLIPHTYTVTFDSTGGSEVTTKTMTATYGKPLANMPVPRREGYVFLGWYDAMVGGKCYGNSDGNGTSAYDKDGNITLYAQWTVAPSRMVYFNTCGGTMTGSTEVLHKTNTPIAKPSDPTKVGYTFTGWYTDSAFTQAWNFDDWVTGELRLYAGWTVNQYTITIKPENGEADTIIRQDFGTAVTAPNLTKTGYTFMGWDKTFPTTMPAENITVTARWKDSEKPTGEIKISENSWKSFLNNITFGLFFKDTQTVTINAADNSGTVFVSYLVTHQDLSEAELQSLVFSGYQEPFHIDPNGEYIVYAMLVDASLNITYLRSDRITLDNVQPVIGGIENGKTYCKAQTVTINEKYVDTVTVNGTAVTLNENGGFTLAPANGGQRIVVTDKAGNTAEMTVTVNDGHTYGKWVSNSDGTHTRRCTVDGCTGSETKDCSGGTATCTEKAKCSACGAEYGDLNPAHHANLVNVPAKAATTSAEGNIEYWHCGGCGKYYKDAAAQDEITQEDTVIAKRRVYYAPSLYPVRNGTNPPSGTEYSGGIYGLIFRAAVSGITGVQVDGRTVGRGSYTVEGSYPVELYLKASYLNRLAKGSHTLTVLTDSGSLTAAFTVGSGKSSPATFDAGIAAYTAAAVTSLTGLELLRRRRKEEE